MHKNIHYKTKMSTHPHHPNFPNLTLFGGNIGGTRNLNFLTNSFKFLTTKIVNV